jgi:hypothetical protein
LIHSASQLEYVQVAATDYLTVLHTGGRSKADIDAGGVLPGYTGTLVRDGYAGYTSLMPITPGGAHYPDLRIIPTWARHPLIGGVFEPVWSDNPGGVRLLSPDSGREERLWTGCCGFVWSVRWSRTRRGSPGWATRFSLRACS